jgi:dipeptidase E
MRFLLTSGGITNTSIYDALVDLLGKPIAESSASKGVEARRSC